MLDVDVEALFEETEDAIKWRDTRIGARQKMIESYQTPWHRGASETKGFDSENHAYEYIALMTAKVVFDNPKWDVQTSNEQAQEIDAPALRDGLNRLTRDVKFRKTLLKTWVDFCFGFCCGITRQTPVPYTARKGKPMTWRPEPFRMSPRVTFFDHRTTDLESRRFAGHELTIDKDDAIREAKENPDSGWNLAVLKALPTGIGLDRIRGDSEKQNQAGRDRKELVLRPVWVPEYQLPDDDPFWNDVEDDDRANYHGTIFTLAGTGPTYEDDQQTRPNFPKKPVPFYGPSWGPYTFGGSSYVPDDPMPLSNLVAVEGQNRQNNAVARAVWEAVTEYKRILATSHRNPKFGAMVKKARHGDVVPADLQDLSRMLASVEVGGLTDQLVGAKALFREVLEHASGLTEARSGVTRQNVTATATAVAEAGSTSREAIVKQQFTDFTADWGRTMAWYLHTDNRTVYDLGPGQGTFFGGAPSAHATTIYEQLTQRGVHPLQAVLYVKYMQDRYEATPFEAFDFNIQPMSMERASEQGNRQKMAVLMPLVMSLAQIAAAAPWLNVKQILATLGQAFDMPDLAKVIDSNMLRQAVQMMQAEQISGIQAAREPKLESDVRPATLNTRAKTAKQASVPSPSPTPKSAAKKPAAKSAVKSAA